MFDDEGMDDEASAQSRYPTMPSLVALQQMKNRLHLAYLGKKLMKWTTLATAKELRKIAHEMNENFIDYGDDYARAFMLLARSRYYYPSLNTIVLENVGNQAACTVEITPRSVAGVKLQSLRVVEENFDTNEHLGIERGGTTITDTKKAWRDLLKLTIYMLQERQSFDMLHCAHKVANKKQNVLGKLVIPRIQNAIAYIKSELEEQEREETFRLKRFKQSKEKKTTIIKDIAKKAEKLAAALNAKSALPLEPIPESPKPALPEPEPPAPEPPAPILSKTISVPPEPNIIVHKERLCCTKSMQDLDQSNGKFICPICKLADRNIEMKVIACKQCLPEVNEAKERAEHLMAHINQVLSLSRQYNKTLGDIESKTTSLNYANIKQELENMNINCPCPHVAREKEVNAKCVSCLAPSDVVKDKEIKSKCADSCLYIEPPDIAKEKEVKLKAADPCLYEVPTEIGKEKDGKCKCVDSRLSEVPRDKTPEPRIKVCMDNTPLPIVTPVEKQPDRNEPCCAYKEPVSEKKSVQKPKDCCKFLEDEDKPEPEEKDCCGYKEHLAQYKVEREACYCAHASSRLTGEPCACDEDTCPTTKSDFQTYNLCSIPAIPLSYFRSSSNLYQPAPPFFYLYSGHNVHSQTCIYPISNGNMNPQIDTIAQKCLCSDAHYSAEFLQDKPICPCKSLEKPCTCNDLLSHPPSKELCICESSENIIPVKISLNSLQCNPTALICKERYQCYLPTSSLLSSNLSSNLATRIAKASEPYLKNTRFTNSGYPVREGSKNKMPCPCESVQIQTSFSCNSCASSCSENSAAKAPPTSPYFKKSTTYFTDVNQSFMPLLSCTKEGATGSCNLTNSHKTTNGVTLSSTSISSNPGCLNRTLNLNTGTQNSKTYAISNTRGFSSHTCEGKPGPCGISEISYTTSSLGSTKSNHSKIITHQIVEENTRCYDIFKNSSELCSGSPISLFNKFDPRSSHLVPYPQSGISGTHSISDMVDSVGSEQCSVSETHDHDGKSPNSTLTKHYSIYITMNPHEQPPYKTMHTSEANIFETSHTTTPETTQFKDSATYVTVVPKKMETCTRERMAMNRTEFLEESTSQDLRITKAMNSQNVQSCYGMPSIQKNFHFSKAVSGHSRVHSTPYTREGKPGPCGLPLPNDSVAKDNTTRSTQEEMSVVSIIQYSIAEQSIPYPLYICINKSRPCVVCDKNPKSLSLPFTREGIPGPCGVSKTRISADSLNTTASKQTTYARPVPYTRQGIPGPCGLSGINKTNSSVCEIPHRGLTNFKSYTREGRSGPCGVFERNNIVNPSKNMNSDKVSTLVSYTSKEKQGFCNISDRTQIASILMNMDLNQSKQDLPRTTKCIPGLCSFSEASNFARSLNITASLKKLRPYTRQGMPGPCGLPMPKNTSSSLDHVDVRESTNLAPHTSESRPSSYNISRIKNTIGSRANTDSRQLTYLKSYTREGRAGPYDIPMLNNTVGSRANIVSGQYTGLVPYTREGRPGPCGIVDTNNTSRSLASIDSSQFTNLAPYTREGRPGPCNIPGIKTAVKSRGNINSGLYTNLAPYTREGRPGPYDISRIKNTVGSRPKIDSRQYTDLAPYTREGRPGPCSISRIKNTVESRANIVSGQYTGLVPYTREGRPGPCGIADTNNTSHSRATIDSSQFTNLAPYTREGRPGPCNISRIRTAVKSRANINSGVFTNLAPNTREGRLGPYDISRIKNTVGLWPKIDSRQYIDLAFYTREGRPGVSDISNIKNISSVQGKTNTKYTRNIASCVRQHPDSSSVCVENNITCSLCTMDPKESSHLVPYKTNPTKAISTYDTALMQSTPNTSYTRKGIPKPCGVSETNIASSLKKIHLQHPTHISPYTREGMPGPCGLRNLASPLGNILPRQPTNPVPFTREGRSGPCDISEANTTASLLTKINSRQSTHVALYTREGMPGPCGLSERKHFVRSSGYVNSIESKNLNPHSRESANRTCGALMSNSVLYTSSKQSTRLAIYRCESKPGPCGAYEPHSIADSDCKLNSRQSKKLSEFCYVSETKNVLNSIYNRSCKQYTHNLLCTGENKSISGRVCGPDGIACPHCDIDPRQSTNLASYTREKIPGPCGISECNLEYKNFQPYTREGVPGPCGIFKKGLTFPCYETFASYTCQLHRGSWNTFESTSTTDSSKFTSNTSIPQQYNLEPYSRWAQSRPSDIKEYNFYDTQSCLMCQVYTAPFTRDGPQYSVNHSTKDATTYVTAIPCPLAKTRKGVLTACDGCDRKSNFSTSGTKNTCTSTRICKARSPHIRLNVTRSLNSVPPVACSTCRPYATPSAAPMIFLNSYMLPMASSANPSRTCYCKTNIPSVSTLRSGPTCNESQHSAASKKCCSICGRLQSQAKVLTTSVPILKSKCYANCDRVAASRVSICAPCVGCGKAKLLLSCASNPSVKSVAIGTCASRCTSSKAASQSIPKSSTKTSHCSTCQKNEGILPCHTCFKKRGRPSASQASASDSRNTKSCSSAKSIESKALLDESKFGYFEIGFKKVTKIYRHKNPDGTIRDEKRIITIKTTKKCPEILAAAGLEAETVISNSLANETNGIGNRKENCGSRSCRQSKSDVIPRSIDPMTLPIIRHCISVQDCNNTTELIHNNCLSPGYVSSNIALSKPAIYTETLTTTSISNTVAASNSLICANRLKDTDSRQKCDCTNKLSQNSSTPAPTLVPSNPVCANRLKDTDSGPKYDCKKKLSSKTTTQIAIVRPVPPNPICANRLQDSDSGPKCDCANKSLSKPTIPMYANHLQDMDNVTICSCSRITFAAPIEPVCANRLQDSDSGPKCDCANKLPSMPIASISIARPVPPNHVCANRLQDSDSGPKCDCANKSPSMPPTPVCANRVQDSDSGSKCDCANKLHSMPSTSVCANRLQDSDSGPKCDCANKSPPVPPTPVCANRLEDSDSGPKCDCANKLPSMLTSPVCANRVQDSDSGPKCDCANKSPSMPPTPVCANRVQDSDSGPKCDCANKSPPVPPTPVCANRLEDSDSGPKCDCANKLPSMLTSPLCTNRLEDSDSGPKCDCANKSPSMPPTPVCANRVQDSDSGPKCDCANKLHSMPSTPVCANRLQDSDSGPKCDCANKSLPVPPTPVCANRLEDSDSGPKCDCANKLPSMLTSPVCTNRLEHSDSGPKCDCANKSPSIPIAPISIARPVPPNHVCANRLQDSNSGPKCDCANKSPSMPPTPVCANRLQDSDSGPKCNCANKSPSMTPTPVCANRLQDSDSGPRCDCANKSPSMPPTPVCANKLQDSDSGPKCDCVNKSPFMTTVSFSVARPVPPNPVCANRLQDSDSGPKCDCANKSPIMPIFPVCANRLQDSDSGQKCDCANSLTTSQVHDKELQDMAIVSENDNNLHTSPSCPCDIALKINLLQKLPLDSFQRDLIKELLPLVKSQTKEVCCSIQKQSGIMKCSSDMKEKRLKGNEDRGYIYIVPSKKSVGENSASHKPICNGVFKINVACSTTDSFYCKPKMTSMPICPNKIVGVSCPIKIIPKASKSRCCSTSDTSKLSTLGVNMLDALRQLFQSSNSRTQNRRTYDKNICKTCYSPLSDINESRSLNNCPLCIICKEKFIDEHEQDYRLTNYCTEPGSPVSKSSPSPFVQVSYLSKNSSVSNPCYSTMVSTVVSTESDGSFICKGCNGSFNCETRIYCTDAETSTRQPEESIIRGIRKGKIEHASLRNMKDCGSNYK